MKLINDIAKLKQVVSNNGLFLLYVQAPDCGLCSMMLNKIEMLVSEFENLISARSELQVVPQLAGTFMVATAPTVLLFANGREICRAGNFIDVLELRKVLSQWNEAITD